MIVLVYLIIAIVLFIQLGTAPATLDAEFIKNVLLLDLLALLIFVLRKKNREEFKKSLLRHSVFFLLGFTIVHFQFPLIYVLYGKIESTLDIWVDPTIVCKSLCISSLGLVSFLIGYDTYKFRSKNKYGTKQLEKYSNFNYKYLEIAAFLLFFGFVGTANSAYLAGNYGSVGPGAAATYMQYFLDLTIFSLVICKVWNLKQHPGLNLKQYFKYLGTPLISVIMLYAMLMLFIGDRGPVVSLMLLTAGGYAFYRKNWPRPIAVFGFLFAGVFIMNAIGVARSFNKDMSFSDRLTMALTGDNGNTTANDSKTSELAGSVRTLHYAVSAVPQKYDYTYGRFQVQQVITAIPGVGSFIDKFIDSRLQYKGSASFITYLEQGNNPTSGTGTTCIADLFIDFDVYGVIIGMLLFGRFIRRNEIVAFGDHTTTMLLWAFAMVYFARSINIGRASVLFFVKDSLWTYAIIYLNNYLFTPKKHGS
jgi:hypothetical protein